jgi:hypothetical protein
MEPEGRVQTEEAVEQTAAQAVPVSPLTAKECLVATVGLGLLGEPMAAEVAEQAATVAFLEVGLLGHQALLDHP